MVLIPKPEKSVVDKFPPDMRIHSYNVCNLAVGLATYYGLSKEEIEVLATGALIHDIGKCRISPDILQKPGRLSEYEYNQVKKHTVLGTEMIKQFEEGDKYESIILYHHERWDGRGYWGLMGREIPLLARIVTIADSFDAMTSFRIYQEPRTFSGALQELNENKGTQFDPELVEIFEDYLLKCVKSKGILIETITNQII